MKAFRKWWHTYTPGDFALSVAEEGWKAALEMVKNEIFEHRDALNVIEEELETP